MNTLFGVQEMLPFIVLALGGGLFVGNIAALVRPPATQKNDGDLEQAPLVRTLFMSSIGLIASIWAIASLLA